MRTTDKRLAVLDTEVSMEGAVLDCASLTPEGAEYHGASVQGLVRSLEGAAYFCGHNIVHFDLPHLRESMADFPRAKEIDTLYLSPLLFPKRPYHRLLKDDKLQVDQLNNPLSDCRKALELFRDEEAAFLALPSELQQIYCALLSPLAEFAGFLDWMGIVPDGADLERRIRSFFDGKFCAHAPVARLIADTPAELAYALALIHTEDPYSVTPAWLEYTYPKLENVLRVLRQTPCKEGCPYCEAKLDIHAGLRHFFGFQDFRKYNGEPLQERAAKAAADGESLLAVFPTGGGKSITFQLPALMAAESVRGLTVVISPLQSLMKDQVDNLVKIGIDNAVTVNGMLDPIERQNALERVQNGQASLLYISPEMLRSRTITRLLEGRNVVRFVIDEAHCFSAWGQDFRVDYLYIAPFLRELHAAKHLQKPIPVSCFTATAKQKVIQDIRDYFRKEMGLQLRLFATSAARENLRYTVLFQNSPEEKYETLRNLIVQKKAPTIVYASRTRATTDLADRLTQDGIEALPFHGQMESAQKTKNQDAFLTGDVSVITATSAFGMGVDKKDVGLVVHYDISASLEDYVQEAGRAGRDPTMEADCYVLFSEGDLDKHFLQLNRSKLTLSEIQQIWKAIKGLTGKRGTVCCSALEIAREAGWDDDHRDIETKVRAAVNALETAGYVSRGKNVPHVYATSIKVNSMMEASARLEASPLFQDEQLQMRARRILQSLISSRSTVHARGAEAESRVDYLADMLGIAKEEVVNCVNLMRQEGLLEDNMDMSAVLQTGKDGRQKLERCAVLETFLLSQITEDGFVRTARALNEDARNQGLKDASEKRIRSILFHLRTMGYIRKEEDKETGVLCVRPRGNRKQLTARAERRQDVARYLLERFEAETAGTPGDRQVRFSLVGLLQDYRGSRIGTQGATLEEVKDALLFLARMEILKLEDGFAVLYNGMELKQLKDNRAQYRREDYRLLDAFYQQRIQQIHIVGEYANLMVRDYSAALQFVQDYFQMDYQRFLHKYFKGDREREITRNITPQRYQKLFGELSQRQLEIIQDDRSPHIVVAAGPGSGKTRLLVHKLAAILTLEDVKSEQLLMLTFSRAAATEFYGRLLALVGSAARYVEIRTFHSYAFRLLGRSGSLEDAESAVQQAAALLRSGGAEPAGSAKRVLVIDEAQDMSAAEFDLVQALLERNDGLRIIAVGDDDQNIYAFRGSSAQYMRMLPEKMDAVQYNLIDNYRSGTAIVSFANAFASTLQNRMKTEPIAAVREEAGGVAIVRHTGANLEQAVVAEVCARQQGSACVLTRTNDEALVLTGMLQKKGIPARLIQSQENSKLIDILEVRSFLMWLDREQPPEASVYSPDSWDSARDKLHRKFQRSACLWQVEALLDAFREVHSQLYQSDLEEYLWESRLEDAAETGDTVYVSTVHKAKGHEFRQVWLLWKGCWNPGDEERRQIYVAATRAQDNLSIHTDTTLFDEFMDVPGVSYRLDSQSYPDPDELALQLGHRDLFLDWSLGESKKKNACTLCSGDPLQLDGIYLTAQINGKAVPVARLSQAGQNRIAERQQKGWYPVRAAVRYVVAWRKHYEDGTTGDAALVLPDLWFQRRPESPDQNR